MTNTLFLPEIREMLSGQSAAELNEFCTALHPARIAEYMEGLTSSESWEVLRNTDPQTRAYIFSYFDLSRQIEIIESIPREEIGHLITDLASDERVDILSRVESLIRDQILTLLPAEDRRDVLRLSNYPEGTAGALMTTQFFRLSAAWSVDEALAELRKKHEAHEVIYYLYVVDEGDHLLGLVSLRELVLAQPSQRIGEIMQTDLVSVDAQADQEEVARKLAQYDFLAMPVVDQDRHLVGIVTHDDVIDMVVEAATEDVHRLGGMTPIDENYLDVPFRTVWWRRTMWLSILFLASAFTFTAQSHFRDSLAETISIEVHLVLGMFVSLLVSTGGNSGSQAATLITRAMALGQIRLTDWYRVMRHELAMGLALGLTLGILGFLRVGFVTSSESLGTIDRWTFAWVLAQAVAAICLWGTMVGATLPLIFRRMGLDPAYASGPFVATFVDVTGIVIYFTIVRMYLV